MCSLARLLLKAKWLFEGLRMNYPCIPCTTISKIGSRGSRIGNEMGISQGFGDFSENETWYCPGSDWCRMENHSHLCNPPKFIISTHTQKKTGHHDHYYTSLGAYQQYRLRAIRLTTELLRNMAYLFVLAINHKRPRWSKTRKKRHYNWTGLKTAHHNQTERMKNTTCRPRQLPNENF